MSVRRRAAPPPGPSKEALEALYEVCGTGDYPAAKKGISALYRSKDLNLPHGPVRWTFLHHAAYRGHAKICKLLLIKGATADIRDIKGWAPVDYATREGHRECVRVLQDEDSIASVLAGLAARKKSHEDSVAKAPEVKKKKHFLKAPPPPADATDRSLQNLVSLLLDAGADPELADLCGQTPLDCARRLKLTPDPKRRDTIVELMEKVIEHRRFRNSRGTNEKGASLPLRPPLPWASDAPMKPRPKKQPVDHAHHGSASQGTHDDDESTEAALLREEIEAAAREAAAEAKVARQEALYNAAGSGEADLVAQYLEDVEDVDVNAGVYQACRTALHAAAFQHRPEVAALLIRWGADVDRQDYIGRTPLAAALRDLNF